VIQEKREFIVKKLKEGTIDHQMKEAYNQNSLLSFSSLKLKKIVSSNLGDEEEPWTVDDEEKGWGLSNEIADRKSKRLSDIFDFYKLNK
jgi:hypothetical protein